MSLLNYIYQAWLIVGITNPPVLKTLLQEDRLLLLLDGMDEVLNQNSTKFLREIRKFSEKYHKNRFVVSCRTAAQKLQLQGSTILAGHCVCKKRDICWNQGMQPIFIRRH